MKNRIYIAIFLCIVISFLAGCAAQAPYFRLDSSLQKDMRTFDGIPYIPLARLCDVYGLECKWDSYTRVATIEKRPDRVILMSGSDRILVNGVGKKLEKPVVIDSGAVFVPMSFVRNNLVAAFGIMPAQRAAELPVSKRFTIKTIVLDPGHGGKDAGAMGRRSSLMEKDTALSLALKIKAILQEAGIKVIMTRSDDTFIPLPRRADISNRARADLFVSVHINASRGRSMRGFECYYLSEATDDNARALEAFENSSLKLGEEASIERSRQLDKALWDMALTENRLESAELASYICDSVEESLAMGNRGVRSARFYVLKHTHMPSVLVESGYISNRFEEMKLKDPKFLDRMADSVARGILKYKREFERTEGFTRS